MDCWYAFTKATTGEYHLSVWHGDKPHKKREDDWSPLVKLDKRHFFPDGKVNLDLIIAENPGFAHERRAVSAQADG